MIRSCHTPRRLLTVSVVSSWSGYLVPIQVFYNSNILFIHSGIFQCLHFPLVLNFVKRFLLVPEAGVNIAIYVPYTYSLNSTSIVFNPFTNPNCVSVTLSSHKRSSNKLKTPQDIRFRKVLDLIAIFLQETCTFTRHSPRFQHFYLLTNC